MMKKRMSTGLVTAMTLALGLGTAMAQTGAGTGGSQAGTDAATSGAMQHDTTSGSASSMGQMPGMSGNGKASAQDKLFLKNATDGSLFEIKTSELALKKSNSDDIKQYAQQMIDDHNKLITQMQPVAAQAGVTPPTNLVSKMHKAEYKKLQGLSGDAFDKEYITAQLTDHQKSDADFKMEQASGSLSDEKAAAAQGEPIVAQHMQKIQQIAQAHNVSVTASSSM